MPRASGRRASRRASDRGSGTISPHERAWDGAGGDAAPFGALPFGSCFAYSPGGSGPACEAGRALCVRLKAADRAWLPCLASRVWLEAAGHGRFTAALNGGVVLVPVPGSAPAHGAPWVGERLAWCLKEVGLAGEIWPALRRRHAVRKSAFAPAGERPSVLEHYESFVIEPGLPQRAPAGRLRLTLVDDVITRGRTMLAAAGRLREAFPGAEIRAFALLRTLARDERPGRLLDPCEGEVRWVRGDARRMP